LQTDVPPPVAGAKPVTVEHIKVHGTALEGNLEGDTVDSDSERQLHKLLDTNPAQNQPNLRENNKWPKNLLSELSEQFSTESCADLPLLQVVGHSCLGFKRDLHSCVHFLPA